jgi:hypothetical protein
MYATCGARVSSGQPTPRATSAPDVIPGESIPRLVRLVNALLITSRARLADENCENQRKIIQL